MSETKVMDHSPVRSYAMSAVWMVKSGTYTHLPRVCPCLLCADVRAYIGWPPLVPNVYAVMVVPEQREDKAS